MVRIVYCDKCGVKGEPKGSSIRVLPVRAGLESRGRMLDLCGECRMKFTDLLNEWMQPVPAPGVKVTMPDGRVWFMLPGEYDFDGRDFSIPVHLQRRGTSTTGPPSSPDSAPDLFGGALVVPQDGKPR